MINKGPNLNSLSSSASRIFREKVKSVQDLLSSEGIEVDISARLADTVNTVNTNTRSTHEGEIVYFNSRSKSLTITGRRDSESSIGDTHEIVHASSRVKDLVPKGYDLKHSGDPSLPNKDSPLRRSVRKVDSKIEAAYKPAAVRKIGPYTEIRRPVARIYPSGHEEARWVVQDFFYALMEAITDEEAHRAHENARGWLSRAIKPAQHQMKFYEKERVLLRTISSQLARRQAIGENEAMAMFWRVNHFGWTKECKNALREAFGPNALRVLAVLSTSFWRDRFYRVPNFELAGNNSTLSGSSNETDYNTFFTTDDIEARENAAKRILRYTQIPYRELSPESNN